jgi:branched-chain amino acid aminotransferase
MSKQQTQYTDYQVYFRGKLVDFKKAQVSIANTTFLYGLGVFTGMRAHYNQEQEQLYVFRPEKHYQRLKHACKLSRFKQFLKKYPYSKFKKIVKKLLQVNQIKQDVYIRVTEFIDENGIAPKFGYDDALAIYLYPLGDYVPTEGMSCQTSSWRRIEDNALPARAKFNGAYVNTALAKSEALNNGYDEGLVLDQKGHVVEGSAENIFLVRDGTLITPPVSNNVLEGVTRQTVIDLAQDRQIPVKQREIDRTELYFADEIFLCGTGAKVSPVTQVDGYQVGNGAVGPISAQIQASYFQAVKGELAQYQDWLLPIY